MTSPFSDALVFNARVINVDQITFKQTNNMGSITWNQIEYINSVGKKHMEAHAYKKTRENKGGLITKKHQVYAYWLELIARAFVNQSWIRA